MKGMMIRKMARPLCCVILLCGIIVLCGCSGKPSGNEQKMDDEDMTCLCPPTIFLQPYGNYTQKEAAKLQKELEKLIEELFGQDLDYEVLPTQPLPDSLLNQAKTRYRADKIIKSLSAKADKHHVYIGLTHKDISCSIRGKADWGYALFLTTQGGVS